MQSIAAPRDWTTAQHFAVWIGLFTTMTGLVGLIINPDFATGEAATAEPFLGVDWNGWHGVAALSVGIPGLAVAAFPRYAVAYLVYRALSDAAVGLWTLLDDRPLGLLYLPTNGDTVLHLVIAAVATTGIVLDARRPARPVAV